MVEQLLRLRSSQLASIFDKMSGIDVYTLPKAFGPIVSPLGNAKHMYKAFISISRSSLFALRAPRSANCS